jgi:hypothetical protein
MVLPQVKCVAAERHDLESVLGDKLGRWKTWFRTGIWEWITCGARWCYLMEQGIPRRCPLLEGGLSVVS